MVAATYLLALAGAASATVSTGLTGFNGTGQLRAIRDVDGTDLGCITSAGLWTVDEADCGTFVSTTTPGTSDYVNAVVSNSDGAACANSGAGLFSCASTNQPFTYFVSDFAGQGGVDHLWTADLQGVYAAVGQVGPPAPGSPAQIELWGGSSKGDFVALGWQYL